MSLLDLYVQGWREATSSVIDLLPTLSDEEWAASTDCPDWTVHDVTAHLAHLEHDLASGTTSSPVLGGTDIVSAFTQAGVDARSGMSHLDLIDELASAVAIRSKALDELPEDPHTRAPVTPAGVDWTWDTLLRNRCIDVWVHEQDIRRAIGRSGGLDSTGAHVTTNTFKSAMSYVVGKKVRPAPGTTIGWHITGQIPFELAVVVGEDGRAKPTDVEADDLDVLLTMGSEAFAVLGAGRRTADLLDVTVAGDPELADVVLAAMPVTF